MSAREQQLLRRLESYLQLEIGVQSNLLACLDIQVTALKTGTADEILEATEALGLEFRTMDARAKERGDILRSLAQHFGVEPETLTLSSIVERFGEAARGVAQQRLQLRELAGQVVRRSRRTSALARAHGQVLGAALEQTLQQNLPDSGGARLEEGGALVNAEA